MLTVRRLALLGALLACALAADASQTASSHAADEQTIRQLLDRQVAAWNAGDARRFAARMTPGVSFTNIFGMVMYGADAFEERHATILSTFYKGTTKHMTVKKIRFIRPDVAIVDLDNEVRNVHAMAPGILLPPDGVVRTQLMEVLVRKADGWWIEAYHNVDTKTGQ